ncbi:hypothetical protein [Proteiniphilum sp.]|nr:hypothetical protein [Proteiniphilum sp.]MEA4917507.1 hypothetical protein [Proteiniphilum sp.]MEA4950722.1 hypothetical protein [Petrimonas sp.]
MRKPKRAGLKINRYITFSRFELAYPGQKAQYLLQVLTAETL